MVSFVFFYSIDLKFVSRAMSISSCKRICRQKLQNMIPGKRGQYSLLVFLLFFTDTLEKIDQNHMMVYSWFSAGNP